jgi:hypothetical protein
MDVVLFFNTLNDEYIKKSIITIERLHPGKKIFAIGLKKITFSSVKESFIWNPGIDRTNWNRLEDTQYLYLYCLGVEGKELPRNLVRDAFSKNSLKGVAFIDNNGAVVRPFYTHDTSVADNIMVFPGPIYPINMGSHQRAFGVLESLNLTGNGCDVLITSGSIRHSELAQNLLLLVCREVNVYKNTRKKLKNSMRFRRFIESKYRPLFGLKGTAPDLFAERLHNKATTSAKITLARLVKNNKYKNVLVNYAWMMPVLEKIQTKIKVICDTHDVQYVRGKSNNKGEFRFFVSSAKEKRLEISSMSKADFILAISKSDRDELLTVLNPDKVRLCVSAFDYAKSKVKKTSEKKPLDFGFIGGKMDANVKSLLNVLYEWWPKIEAFSPDSKFYIAGSICTVPAVRQLAFLKENIILMGFVDSLSSFYRTFDISLNPVLVKGGLNFKSVESMVAGKILITNTTGVKCLFENPVIRVADTGVEVLKFIENLDQNRNFLQSQARLTQKLALSHFSNECAYDELLKLVE